MEPKEPRGIRVYALACRVRRPATLLRVYCSNIRELRLIKGMYTRVQTSSASLDHIFLVCEQSLSNALSNAPFTGMESFECSESVSFFH